MRILALIPSLLINPVPTALENKISLCKTLKPYYGLILPPPPPPGDHSLNELESALPEDVCILMTNYSPAWEEFIKTNLIYRPVIFLIANCGPTLPPGPVKWNQI